MKTSSVVLLPAVYAACDNGILFSILSCILLIIQFARIFLIMDNSMIGLRFAGGPDGFPGLGSGTSTSSITLSGILPVFPFHWNFYNLLVYNLRAALDHLCTDVIYSCALIIFQPAH